MLPLVNWIKYQRDAGIITEEAADRQFDVLEKEREYEDSVRRDLEEDVWRNM